MHTSKGATIATIETKIARIESITEFTELDNPNENASLNAFLIRLKALTIAAVPPPNNIPMRCFTMILFSPKVPVSEVIAIYPHIKVMGIPTISNILPKKGNAALKNSSIERAIMIHINKVELSH